MLVTTRSGTDLVALRADLLAVVASAGAGPGVGAASGDARLLAIPCRYDGPDLDDVARHTGLTVAEVPAELRPDLLVAGDVSADFAAYEADLHALVEAHGLTGSVHFIGPQSREHLAGLMRGARIVLVPSHSETFGLIALEAAASGAPVLALVISTSSFTVWVPSPVTWAGTRSAMACIRPPTMRQR